MMETYADRLKREGRKQMTNYDMDQLRREGKVPNADHHGTIPQADYDGMLGQTDTVVPEWNARRSEEELQESSTLEIDLDKGDALKLALQAHDKKVTLNQHIIDVLTDQLLTGVDAKELLRKAPRGKQELLKEY
jgi:predicted HicB family RNase H-like nuclease